MAPITSVGADWMNLLWMGISLPSILDGPTEEESHTPYYFHVAWRWLDLQKLRL